VTAPLLRGLVALGREFVGRAHHGLVTGAARAGCGARAGARAGCGAARGAEGRRARPGARDNPDRTGTCGPARRRAPTG
jgi:hypothetical protein